MFALLCLIFDDRCATLALQLPRRVRLPIVKIENTMIGILFSREKLTADASITFKSRDRTS